MEKTSTGKSVRGRQRKPRRRDRRHCIPPAIMREPDETLESIHVLEENRNRPDVAILLFRAVRAITLWATTGEEARADLFTKEGAEKGPAMLQEALIEPELETPLLVLLAVPVEPLDAEPGAVTAACLAVANWAATSAGALGTALAFAQAASLASPDEPLPAREAARYALRWGRVMRAESWMRVALGLARRATEWRIYTQALIALGDIHARRSELPRAKQSYRRACLSSRRHALREERARAFHGLFVTEMQLGALEDADRHAGVAMRLYHRHPRVRLDYANLLILKGEHPEAIAILNELIDALQAHQRALGLALLARAAAGAQELRTYSRAWTAAWEHVRRREHPASESMVILHLAHAAAGAGDWRAMQQVSSWCAEDPQRLDAATGNEVAELMLRHLMGGSAAR